MSGVSSRAANGEQAEFWSTEPGRRWVTHQAELDQQFGEVTDLLLAACAVRHDSARIGEARSTLDEGVLGHCNALAEALGASPGLACSVLVGRLTAQAAAEQSNVK